MGYRLYILSIRDLLDEKVRNTAITYLDSHRRELVDKYKREQDQLRAIAAGLLLQVGFWEIGKADMTDEPGLSVKEVFARLQEYADKHALSLPAPLSYEYGPNGKPSWESRCIDQLKPDKEYTHFNLSHSGDYVVLAISDRPVGVDIQMQKETSYPGGYRAFSRMEAYVKCTGDGIANGRKEYEFMRDFFEEYVVCEMEFLDKNTYYIVVVQK